MPTTTNPQHPRRGNRRGDSGGVSHERRGGGGTIDPGEEEIIYDGDYNMNDYDDDYSFSSPNHLTSGGGHGVVGSTASTRSLFEQPDHVASGGGGLDLGSVSGTSGTRPGLGSRSSSTRSSTTTGSGSGQNSLSTEAAKARRRSEREEKLRQMNDAVSYASGTVAETRSSVSMSMSGMQGMQGMSAQQLQQQQQHDMSEIRLRSDGRDGSPNGAHTGLLHGTATDPSPHDTDTGAGASSSVPIADRIKNILPTYQLWGDHNGFDGQNHHANANPSARGFPDGSSLSTRSLTTTGRNLHDIGTTVSKPPSRAFGFFAGLGGGGGSNNNNHNGRSGNNASSSNNNSKVRLNNSGITIDYFDPDTEAAQWHANGNQNDTTTTTSTTTTTMASNISSRFDDATAWFDDNVTKNSGNWRRQVNTVLEPVRAVMPTNRKKCMMWMAVLAIVGVILGTFAKIEEDGSGGSGASVKTTPPPGAGSSTNIAPDVNHDPHDKTAGQQQTKTKPSSIDAPFDNPNIDDKGNITPVGTQRLLDVLTKILDGEVSDAKNLPTKDDDWFQPTTTNVVSAAIPEDKHATPQYKALLWLACHDERQISVDDEYLLERYALAVFWYATYEASRLADIELPPDPGDDNEFNFLKHDGWLSPLGICSWEGIECHHLGIDKTAVRYDADHTVTHFNLTRNSVRGTIPDELWTTFVDLRVLDLSHNLLQGTMSEDFGTYDELEVVYLNDNFIEGTLPNSLFNPKHESKLEIFDVGDTFIGGTIPREIGRLANLKRLALYTTGMSGTIPVGISELRRLDTLYLDSNQFTGTIPPEISELTELRDLRLRDNKLTSSIPSELGELKKVEYLYLDTNQLSGPVPAELGQMSRLEELHLYKNKLTSNLPFSLGDLRYLQLLYMDSNQFTGTIPDSYGDGMHDLQQLYLYNNQLTGTIPEAIYGLDDVEEIRVGNNKLSGSLPNELGYLLKLKHLHIENNLFSGTLPESMENLEDLEALRIHENDFTGSVPDGICLLRTGGTDSGSLDEFVADCDEFDPRCPCCTECIAHNKPAKEQPDVHVEPEEDPTAAPTPTPPDLNEELEEPGATDRLNKIKHRLVEDGITSPQLIMPTPKGDEPTPQRRALEWLADEDERQLAVSSHFLHERYALASFWFSTYDYAEKHEGKKDDGTPLPNWLSTNNWMSSAPTCSWFGVHCEKGIDADGSVDEFNVTNNGIRGYVPEEFYKGLTDVKVFDVSHNLLNGTIADSIGHWPDLRLLYVNQNYFTGQLPGSIFSPLHKSKLEILDFGGNFLSGTIPNEIGDLDNLVRLALYENWLTGTISPFLANCKKLDTLYLDSNDLGGTIPPMVVSQLTELQDLRLRSNHLTGPIPSDVDNLSKLKLLYLDDNELTSTIPASLGSLVRLEEMHLYKNKLTGPLPSELGNLRYLTLLYLDSNQLDGPIPDSFGELHSLQQLFLFNNRLTGPIPSSLYGIENVEELRLNNNELSGSLPTEIGQLLKLRNLHLENNEFTGSLPHQMGNMDDLEELRIQNNGFTESFSEGGLDSICLLRDQSLAEFVSDCDEISCDCCSQCP